MGEMVAGILLGPSFVGMLFPGVQAFLFPAASLDALRLLSQIGVILFMFVVGMTLDVQHIRQKAHAAVLVSHASIIVPFFLGTAFSLLIYRSLVPAHISFSAFALFMGISMSITAFPVLACIIEERGLSRSYLGSVAIACAAVDDVTAWCLLAVVVAIAQAHGLNSAILTIVLALLFIGLMLFLLRPQAGRMLGKEVGSETQSKGLMAGVLTFVFAAALFTEVIGIHALFGAFLAGVILPAQARLSIFLRERLETFSSVFLLPLFFVFTGLRTQIGLLNDWQTPPATVPTKMPFEIPIHDSYTGDPCSILPEHPGTDFHLHGDDSIPWKTGPPGVFAERFGVWCCKSRPRPYAILRAHGGEPWIASSWPSENERVMYGRVLAQIFWGSRRNRRKIYCQRSGDGPQGAKVYKRGFLDRLHDSNNLACSLVVKTCSRPGASGGFLTLRGGLAGIHS